MYRTTALPTPEHPAEDHLARGPAPDGEAVGPGNPKKDGILGQRNWRFRPAVVIEEEEEEENGKKQTILPFKKGTAGSHGR